MSTTTKKHDVPYSREDLEVLHYYWQDAGGAQMGPSPVEELRAAWKSKNLHENCYVYGDGFYDWVPVGDIPELKKLVAPPPPPPGGAAKKKQPAPPAAASEAKKQAKKKSRKAPLERQASTSKTLNFRKSGWTKRVTCDMVPYYANLSTGELTWNMPESLRSSQDRSKHSEGWVWVPDEEHGWVAAQQQQQGSQYRLESGEVVKAKRCLALNYASLARLQEDLVLLDSLDEGLILHNLKERYNRDQIYTAVGGILIAINPFQRLPLYTTELIDAYDKAGNKVMAPHPYKLADAAHKALLEDLGDQSILVSGESGSGKTETTKQALSFLAEVAGSTNNIEQRVLSANPILESFGNAKTVRNDNSSRFGRFTAVQFDNQLKIAGASISNYLLEKSRVKGQSEGERNYHVFYELCAGLSCSSNNNKGDVVVVGPAASYNYLQISPVPFDDAADLADLGEAMDALNLPRSEILRVVAAVLKVGQLEFEPLGGMSDGSKVVKGALVEECREELGADGETLARGLTRRTMAIRGETTSVQLRVSQSLENRDALAKFLYDKLFDYLVGTVNRALEAAFTKSIKASIGILDIFGFEIFAINSFEQLCINFTNEKLQQLFNEHTFKTEEAVYRAEGVKFPPIEFVDNQPVCDLIEKRGGIFTLLDDTVKGPGKAETKDAKFSQTIDTALKGNAFYVGANEHRGVRGIVFSVKHYAGTVCYSCDGFVEKNADTLYPDLYAAMSESTNELIASMFPGASTKATLGAAFRKQLASLMETLRSTEPHYVRCVKPNQSKAPRRFEGRAVLEQLTCAGVFEAVKIRKQGYPFRFAYERFVARYKTIMSTNSGWIPFESRNNVRDQAEEIIAQSRQAFPQLERGRTMLLFRADEYRVLELCRALAVDRVSAKIQAKARGRLTRRYLAKVQTVRPALRRALESKDLNTLEAALVKTDEALGVFAHFEVAVPIAEWAAAKEMVALLKEAIRLAQMLEAASEPSDEDLAAVGCDEAPHLEALLRTLSVDCGEIAQKMPVEPSFDQWYEYASQRFANAREARLAPRFDQVMRELEREPMAELYAEAKRLGYETSHLSEIVKLVEMTEEDLLKRQYQRAHETGQADRARLKEIALKEHYLDQYASMFVFERCALLRGQSDYNSAAKIVTLHKSEKKETMLQYSKHKILTSLTRLDNKTSRDALKVYRSIMGYMGEKRTYASSDLCVEVVSAGLMRADLRPEIYCQLMKQLSGNPSPDSSSKGWTLMMMCLLVFPPEAELENYLHIFIRKNAPVHMRAPLSTAAHEISYNQNLLTEVPSIQKLEEMVDRALGRSAALRRKDSNNR
ncbi:hypothetical protein CTAYLR_004053 [Chrysophaeum taylorii]|uniref:Uncharacterized protein n=1 Tax=Chrysophaeum taylorii TaxID=2483200 RepID=A0AAD7UMR6_9STRA|nr:hypothetical protein CTAYLR_004053 [Chrysophaeum taylorii]